MKKVEVKQTLVDNVVAYINPVAGRARYQARAQMALAGSYVSGRRGKGRRSMSEWQVSGGDADSDILPDLPSLREYSRDAVRNNPLAAAIINTKVTSVVLMMACRIAPTTGIAA